MATSNQVKSLMKAHFNNQDERFITIALQIAASESRKGHINVGREYKKIIDEYSMKRLNNTKIDDKIRDLIEITIPHIKKEEVILNEELEESVHRIILEYYKSEELLKYGLKNRRKILLTGSPGTGKTMTASMIATELHLPLCTILIDKMVTKYMGETSVKLREIFNLIDLNAGVYLFDEFDAIGTSRGMDNDVGEIRRVLNSFLQFIENDKSDSIIICATNYPELLDEALFRRFDDVLYYKNPDINSIEKMINQKLELYNKKDVKVNDELLDTVSGLSHSDISSACENAIKRSILDDKILTNYMLLFEINNRKESYKYKNE